MGGMADVLLGNPATASQLGLPSFGLQAVNASALSPVAAPLPPVAATPSLATDLQILNTDFRRWVEGQLSNKGMQVDLSPGLHDYLAHASKLGLTTPAAGAAAGDDTVQDDSETME